MFSVGLAMFIIGFFACRISAPRYPWETATNWNALWFVAFLVGALLMLASVCLYTWRILP